MFTIRWENTALNELATFWIQSDSLMRQLITDATNRIEKQLQMDPLGESESRPGGRRIFFLAPLGITFRIESDEQTLSVLRVWLFRRRGQ